MAAKLGEDLAWRKMYQHPVPALAEKGKIFGEKVVLEQISKVYTVSDAALT